jgi:hypothetical protein
MYFAANIFLTRRSAYISAEMATRIEKIITIEKKGETQIFDDSFLRTFCVYQRVFSFAQLLRKKERQILLRFLFLILWPSLKKIAKENRRGGGKGNQFSFFGIKKSEEMQSALCIFLLPFFMAFSFSSKNYDYKN